MHVSSYNHMQRIAQKHLQEDQALQIYDLGSFDVNGSYKPIFDKPNWQYKGIDLEDGPNVDIVLSDPYRWPMASSSADLIVSGQAFEHIEFFWETWMEMVRALKPGGRIFLIAPSRGPEHRFPQDCWRFYPDGYTALAKFAGLHLEEVSTDWEPHEAECSHAWGDTVGVFYKPHRGLLSRAKRALLASARRLLFKLSV